MEEIKEKDEYVGRKLGDFTVISKAPSAGGKYEMWICRCDKCGTEVYFGEPRIKKAGAKYKCRRCGTVKRRAVSESEEPKISAVESVQANVPVQDPGERFVEIMTAIGYLAEEAHDLGKLINNRDREIAKNRAVLLAIAQVFEKADKMEAKIEGEKNEA